MKQMSYFSLIVSLFLLTACQNQKGGQRQEQRAMPYPVVQVPQKTVTGYTSFPVSIEGTINSAVRAKVSGYITSVLVDEGQRVKKGQTLFEIETQALSQDAGAAKANMNVAQVEVEKLRPLVEKNIISKVQLSTAEAKLAQAKASYNSIVANIAYATIKSPVNGYVGSIPYRQGTLVSPADPMPLTTVSVTDEVYAFFAMNESDYLDFIQNTEGSTLSEKINNFPPVALELVNGSVYEKEGKIETVTGQVNPSTGTVSFRATFPNPSRLLANGSSGKIRIPIRYENAVVVPESATFEQQGRVYVYKLQGDTLAVSATVKVKDRVGSLAVITSGIKAGDMIVAKGVGKIRNNTPIVPQPMPFDSIANSLNVVFK
ncbi:membrane fusion protein, multidrug efflux system [Saccharicrinis carchari]|uniref:Membrane fusion protein, multidrug efflux system n=1 Tax=Saccharicrinis carchari TaxID=1168039 RepID=A0A521CXK7_SACCC|nr:efflux RND transporter periplasmic adaptor subunit [Saccharicrinis carchari]SMO64183.1 membrane fusion protein, multidrug efflux system [Saccharicrinis carchari]